MGGIRPRTFFFNFPVAYRENRHAYIHELNSGRKCVIQTFVVKRSPVQVVCQQPTVKFRPHLLLKQLQETFPGCSAYPATCSGMLVEMID